MAISARRAIFATHRGRVVKRGGLALGALMIGLSILSNVAGGQASTVESAPATVGSPVEVTEPVVAAFVANPYIAEGASYYQSGGSAVAVPERDPKTGLPVEAPTASQGENDVVVVRQVAMSFAVAWATYAPSQDPAAFVASLPGVAPSSSAALLANAEGAWDSMVGGETTGIGTLTGTNPQVQVLDSTAGTAIVVVPVDQSRITRTSEPWNGRISLVVNLARYDVPATEGVGATTTWGVSGVTQN